MIWNGIGIILLVSTLLTVLYCWIDASREVICTNEKTPSMSGQEQ